MFSRIISCNINPAKVNEFKNALNNEFLPRIQAQAGFLENIESLDHVDNYHNGLFQEVAAKLVPLMQGNPTVQTLPVENSSAHNIQAGKAAA